MGRRTLLLITSLLIAAVGTALVALYVRGAESRAEQNIALVKVMVAQRSLPAGHNVGEALSQGYFARESVLQRQVRDGKTLLTPEQIDELSDQQTKGPILEGQVLDRDMFTADAGEVATADGVAANKSTVSVSMADPDRVAPFLQPGSHVAIFLTTGEGNARRTAVVLEDVVVVGVGGTTTASTGRTTSGRGGGGEALPNQIVSLEVTGEEAAKVILAQKSGDLSFAVLGPNAKIPKGTTMDPGRLFR